MIRLQGETVNYVNRNSKKPYFHAGWKKPVKKAIYNTGVPVARSEKVVPNLRKTNINKII